MAREGKGLVMLPAQSCPRIVMRIQEIRPGLRRYQNFLTECSLRNQEMNSSGLYGKLPMVPLHSRRPLRQ